MSPHDQYPFALVSWTGSKVTLWKGVLAKREPIIGLEQILYCKFSSLEVVMSVLHMSVLNCGLEKNFTCMKNF